MNSLEREVIYTGAIAGIPYGHYAFRPDRLKNRDLLLVPEPDNQYDADAVALMVINGTMAHKVGYVPRNQTHKIHKVLKAGKKPLAAVNRIDHLPSSGNNGRYVVYFQVYTLVRPIQPLRPVGTRRLIL